MEVRTLGGSRSVVSRIGLGCATFGREISETDSFAVLDHAVSRGITVLDTAENYGGGQARESRFKQSGVCDIREVTAEQSSSECILGRWLRARGGRDRVVIQTKLLPPLTRPRIVQSVDASLRRLQLETIDVFMLHAFDPNTPLEESLAGLADVLAAGKVRAIGCSNFDGAQLTHANALARQHGLPPLQLVQVNYNLAIRDAAATVFPAARELGVGIETYSPLGAGFLTGKYDASTRDIPEGTRFHIMPGHTRHYFEDAKFEIAQRLRLLSTKVDIPAAQLALAWVWKHQAIDCILIGARKREHIDNALSATALAFEDEWESFLFRS